VEVIGIETFGSVGETGITSWRRGSEYRRALPIVTIFPNAGHGQIGKTRLIEGIAQALTSIRPDVVAVPAWACLSTLAALRWCVGMNTPAVTMSDSTFGDKPRNASKERFKSHLLKLFASAVVGGSPQRAYLLRLGLPGDRIFIGYDVVDNDFFWSVAQQALRDPTTTRQELQLPERFFLCCARLIAKKNISFLLQTFAKYRSISEDSHVNLVIVGEGPLRSQLESEIRSLNLGSVVTMPGFEPYERMPKYYALAEALIHPSTTEQWGLVVNEALASGTPVIVSDRVGACVDLVQEGINGLSFDPTSSTSLLNALVELRRDPARLSRMRNCARLTIADWPVTRFADGIAAAARKALESPNRPAGLFSRACLSVALAAGGTESEKQGRSVLRVSGLR
jgi:glycosyltransferase involved in cell wall biosynthesis